MDIMSNLTLAIFSILGFLLIINGLVVPYLIFLIRSDIQEIKQELQKMHDRGTGAPPYPARSKWKKSRFDKI